MHVFYPELVPAILEGIDRIPVPFDLIVTDAAPEPIDPSILLTSRAESIWYAPTANKGRDILPLMTVVNARLLDGYDLVLKVHTKRSPWRAAHTELDGTGDQWREQFLDALTGTREKIERILGAFAERSDLGAVTAPGSIAGPEHWGSDEHIVHAMLRRVGLRMNRDELEFCAGSVYWIRGPLLSGLYGLEIEDDDFESESGQVDGTTAHGIERLIGVLTREAGLRNATTADLDPPAERAWERYAPAGAPPSPRARVVPFYLPQFHRFEENDAWWGRGFTEWSNVAPARPVYRGHQQPLLPADLGFYDLTAPGVLDAQWKYASSAGVAGFLYYYYWFSGRKLMERPIENHLDSDTNAPFAVMWANENWTRTWDGGVKDVLLAQEHRRVSPDRFIQDVLPLLQDRRYLRVNGAPLIAVYKIGQLPDPAGTVAAWRATAAKAGIPRLLILSVDVGAVTEGHEGDPSTLGMDGWLEFPPHNVLWSQVDFGLLGHVDARFRGQIMSYGDLAADVEMGLRGELGAGRNPTVMVNFDNTPRRGWTADLWVGANPYTFRRWLDAAVSAVASRPPEERLVFVNAWNEWAEGAVLEPSTRFGQSFLEMVRSVVLP